VKASEEKKSGNVFLCFAPSILGFAPSQIALPDDLSSYKTITFFSSNQDYCGYGKN
jgi:hypothetical protein